MLEAEMVSGVSERLKSSRRQDPGERPRRRSPAAKKPKPTSSPSLSKKLRNWSAPKIYQMGLECLGKHQERVARHCFEAVLKKEVHLGAMLSLAHMLLRSQSLSDLKEALDHAKRAYALADKHRKSEAKRLLLDSYSYLAERISMLSEDRIRGWEKALPYLNEIKPLDPDLYTFKYGNALVTLGYLYHDRGSETHSCEDLSKAQAYLKSARRLAPLSTLDSWMTEIDQELDLLEHV